MPSSYPSALDALTNPTATDQKNSSTVPHAAQHANANDAIEAIEAKVGIDASAVTTSLDYIAKVALPKGVLGYAQVTANQTGITTEVDLTGLSVAVTAGTGRRIKITAKVDFATTSGTGAGTELRIKEGTTQLQRAKIDQPPVTSESAVGVAILTPTSGAHTYKLSAVVASGTVTMAAASDFPAFILVEDIGKSG